MPYPVVLIALSLMAGIATADVLFYQRFIVPAWLEWAAWGFCILLLLMSLLLWRRRDRSGFRSWLFPCVVMLFFASVGFMRYAVYASEVHEAWNAMERPPVNRGNPDEFDYVRWRWIQGEEDTTSWMASAKRNALAFRERVETHMVRLGMEEDTLAIMAAMTLGDRSHLDRETRDVYAAAGASHLLALSGLHLGIMVGLLLAWLNGWMLMSRWRKPLGVSIIVFIWLYAFVAGLPTSLVRAALMTSFFVLASLLRHGSAPIHYLVLTIVVMLLCRPVFLFDAGAQLSCLAVAGILVVYRPLYMRAFEHWRFQIFWLERYHLLWPAKIVAVSLCAQLLTWPLVAYYFHQLPTYGVVMSIVLIPLTTLILYLFFGILLLSCVWMGGAVFLTKGLSWLVGAQLWLMSQVAQWPGALIHDFWSRKAEPQVVVYHNRRCPALHLIASPEQSWLLMPEPEQADSGLAFIAKSFWQRRLTRRPEVLEGRSAVAVKGFKAVMIDGSGEAAGSSGERVGVDVLWITKGFEGALLGELATRYAPRLLVLDACLKPWQRKGLREDAERVGWSTYDVAEEGALRFKLGAEGPSQL